MPTIMPDIMPDCNRYKTITYIQYIVFYVTLMPVYLPDGSGRKAYRKFT